MRKMVYFVVMLCIAVALTPFVVGFYIKSHIQPFITTLFEDKHLTVSIVHYHQGWLSSEVELAIKPDTTNLPPTVATHAGLTLRSHITHGPFIYDKNKHTFTLAMAKAQSDIYLPKEITSILSEPPSKSYFHVNSMVYFTGQVQDHYAIPAIKFSVPDHIQFNWEGMQGQSQYQIKQNQLLAIRSNVTFQTLVITVNGLNPFQLTVMPITSKYQINLHPSTVWVGDATLTIPKLMATYQTNNIQIDNAKILLNQQVTSNNKYNLSELFTADKLTIPTPIMSTIAPVNFNLSLNNINASAIANFTKFLNSIQSASMPPTFQQDLVKHISQLISPDSALTSDLYLQTTSGSLSLNINLNLLTIDSNNSLESILKNQTRAVLHLKISAPLANELVDYVLARLAIPTPTPARGAAATGLADKPDSLNQDKIDQFNTKVATLMKDGKLDLPTTMQIISLSNQALSPAQFNDKIAELKIKSDITTQISALYLQMIQEQQISANAATTPQMPPAQQLIDEWIKQGYLIKDKNDYTLSITAEGGVAKINGKEFDPAAVHAPTGIMQQHSMHHR